MIDSFDGTYAFLSNFYPSSVVMYGKSYPTVEHAFQAAKATEPERSQIRLAATPGKAKRLGRRVALPADWDEQRLVVMGELLRRKFTDQDLRVALLETWPHELVEGNTWGDCFWGVCRGTGQNHLGRLLMKLREDLMELSR